jgi:amidohydrolase
VGSEGRLPWPVTVRGIFQPSEETATGALEMIDHGALAGVEAILAAHVDPTRPVGRIAIRPGVLTANCDAMCLAISGQGGHAARPHESKDPIAAAAQLISTLYQFVPRATDSQDAVVVTIGQLIGGENPNVIPEHIELRGTLRTLDQRVRQATVEHVRQLARGISEVSGTKIEVSFESGVGSVENDPLLTRLIGDAAVEVVGEDNLEEILRPSMGSEDFAAYLGHVPGAMFRLGSGCPSGETTSLHTSNFDIDERAIKIGARIFARAVVAWSSPELSSD